MDCRSWRDEFIRGSGANLTCQRRRQVAVTSHVSAFSCKFRKNFRFRGNFAAILPLQYVNNTIIIRVFSERSPVGVTLAIEGRSGENHYRG